QAAQALLQRLSQLREMLAPYREIARRLDDTEAMCELLAEEAEPQEADERELQAELRRLVSALDKLELETLLSGEHDSADAIVEIKAGAGGTDACDWVTMLQR